MRISSCCKILSLLAFIIPCLAESYINKNGVKIHQSYDEGEIDIWCAKDNDADNGDTCTINLISKDKTTMTAMGFLTFFESGKKTKCINIHNSKTVLYRDKSKRDNFYLSGIDHAVPENTEKCPIENGEFRNEL